MTGQPYQVMPPLADAEYDALRASIAAGYDPAHPVVTDENGVTLDGHHRQRVCAELGIEAPTVILPGLTEDQKHDYAVRANLACRHLTQLQKRELVRGELGRNPDRSDREIGRLCGVDHKTVGSVRRGEIPHAAPGDAYLAERARVLGWLGEVGFAADDETVHELTQDILVKEAARGLLRYGVLDTPPAAWKPVQRDGYRNQVAASRLYVVREKNRLAEWEIRVEREVGEFLRWCDAAGITIGKSGITFAGELRYPAEPDLRDMLAESGWTPLDEHQAACGHFYAWWYTRDELRQMSAAV